MTDSSWLSLLQPRIRQPLTTEPATYGGKDEGWGSEKKSLDVTITESASQSRDCMGAVARGKRTC